jgi:flavin-dependent dehydrogenase
LKRGGDEGESKKGRARLVAFKAHLEGARGAPGVCEIYFYPGGYGGLSPVEGGLSNLCFIARAGDVRGLGGDAERVVREVVSRNRRAARTLADARARTRWLAVSVESFGRHEPAPFDGLLAVGDAAAFIDPFTGSGMLMALEGGRLAASAVARWLASEAGGGGADFAPLARRYRADYSARFDARLRLCGLLRRAALAPAALAEAAVVALSASAGLRRRLARATRGAAAEEASCQRESV